MFAGIDSGSVTTKAVIIDEQNRILSFSMAPTDFDRQKSGDEVLHIALRTIQKSKNDIQRLVTTGYGRRSFTSADKVLPEIVCHARGTKLLFPEARTIIDIGGQDSKIIELDEKGGVIRFEMNDKCAAGTGRFLEVLTERILGLPLEELGPLSLKSRAPCTLSSICTVFAESEILSFISEQKLKEDIAYGLNKAIAKRVVNIGKAGQIRYPEQIIFSGGVARNSGVVQAMEEELGKKVAIPEVPQITAALGAALFAREVLTSG